MENSINSNNKENYDKYVVGGPAILGEGRYEMTDRNGGIDGNEMGQVKYAKKGAGKSIYDDPTRDTDNDKAATARMQEEDCPSEDENQGARH